MPQITFPLHPAQQDVYTDQLLNIGKPLYNIGGYIILKGFLNKETLHKIINKAPETFDAFKLRFNMYEPDFLCHYDEEFEKMELGEVDLSTEIDSVKAAENWLQRRFTIPFELSKESIPFEHFLIKISDNEHWLFIKHHHLITDGYGFVVWSQYIARRYHSLLTGEQAQFNYPLYKDEAIKAHNYNNSEDYKIEGDYWKNKIGKKPEKLLQKKYLLEDPEKISSTYFLEVSDNLRSMLEAIQLSTNAGLLQLTIAALAIYFGKTSSVSEYVFGAPIHRRSSKQLRSIIGMFSGVLPFKTRFREDVILSDFLKEILSSQRADYRYQKYLIGDLSRGLKINHSEGYLCEIVINFEPLDFEFNFGEEIKAITKRLPVEFDKNPLQFAWRDYGKQQPLQLQIHFSLEYFNQQEIEILAKRLLFIIEQFPAALDKQIGDINILPLQEQQLLQSFNNTSVIYPWDKSIIHQFEEQVLLSPDAAAVVFEEEELSYRELNVKSNQLARYLQEQGVLQEMLVPVCIERSPEMIISILGILKAGGAYVPIDTSYPKERIRYIIEDTKAQLILSSTLSREKFAGDDIAIIELDKNAVLISKYDSSNLSVKPNPDQLAYIIYTSGSTGKPKGVMIEHNGVVNLALSQARDLRLKQATKTLQFSSLGFDASCYEMFNTFLSGGCLVLCTQDDLLSAHKFEALINKHKVEVAVLPPSYQHSLVNIPGSLTTVVSAGEPLNSTTGKYLQSQGIRLINAYGPTENTVCTTLSDDPIKNNGLVVIGKPISNVTVYILNDNLQLSPVGVTGEVYIGGVQVARGYLNRPELTAERFIPDPFGKEAGGRLYKTGDLGRWLTDGNIEYQGRVDDQVKIRGYRIELGEIESVLEQQAQVKQGVVLAREDQSGNKILVGYVVSEGVFDREAVIGYLRGRLPEYMVPQVWVSLDRLPVTANGKTDRKGLPAAEISDQQRGYEAPGDETEARLAGIWQELLGVEQVGVHDNFFELGGHSLLAMRVISAIRRELGVELGIKELFLYPTVRAQSAHLSVQGSGDVLPAIRAIDPRPVQVPLSFSQERLWFIDHMEGSTQYHMPAVFRLKGEVDKEGLEQALRQVISCHEVLRTIYKEEQDGRVYQYPLSASGWQLPATTHTGDAPGLEGYVQELLNKPFDLAKDYMLRASLIGVGSDESLLVMTVHHIASDGWSSSILVNELISLYRSYITGEPSALAVLPLQYADYSIWQRRYLSGELLERKTGYWKEKLKQPTPLQLPTDYLRGSGTSRKGAQQSSRLSASLSAGVSALSREQGVTVFMTLLAAFKVLLYRYSGQSDIIVGTPIAGRQQQELEGLIGFFVNTLSLRSEVKGETAFTALLQTVKQTTLEAYEHQDVPFEKVVEAVVKERDLSRSPLFQVMFVLQNMPEMPQIRLGEASITAEAFVYESSKFDIIFNLEETAGGIVLTAEYDTALYKAETIRRMTGHYEELLNNIVKHPDEKINTLKLLGKEEEETITSVFSNIQTTQAQDKNIKSITDLFEEQVLRSPEAIAIEFEEKQLSYQELNARSNQVARYLQEQGVKKEILVPVCIERSPEMLIGILGILKAGGAYVPVDPEYPADRIRYMLEDTGATIALSSKAHQAKLQQASPLIKVLSLNEEHMINGYPQENLPEKIQPDQLAYIIYTSGSTGKPKGVMVEHGGVVNLIKAQTAYFRLSAEERILQFSNYSFDASVEQIFLALFNGAALILFREGLQLDADLFGRFVEEKKISHLHATPLFLEHIRINDAGALKRVIAGGDTCRKALAESWQGRTSFYNEYGPTETTVTAIEYHSGESITGETVPIGRPLNNVTVYILNDNLQPSPVGVTGEVYIGGVQVARGYLNRPELTAERFIADPFGKEAGARLYKTGDLGRWQGDGNIEYQGRVDDQVKIRGYRIELGEIESVLEQQAQVKQGVVLAREDQSGNKILVGYVVSEGVFDREAVIGYLRGRLPEYMVPQVWVSLDRLPVTANGKTDRKGLPAAEISDQQRGYEAPGDETEARLAGIWQELLGVEQVGVHDNFFELGGHSLLAMRVISAIRRELGVELGIKELFLYPTVRAQSAHLSVQGSGDVLPAIRAIDPRPVQVPLSFSQERLWFIDHMEGSTQYHMPAVFRLKGEVDKEGLEQALRQVISRHEVLRTIYKEEQDGSVYQYPLSAAGWHLPATTHTGDAPGLEGYVQELLNKPFDLAKDYMLRASLIEVGSDESLLVMTVHHIASDGWSSSILVNELISLYRSYITGEPSALAVLPLQYADYSIWQRRYLSGELLERKTGYWKEKLKQPTPLQLPTDYLRGSGTSRKGAQQSSRLSASLSAGVSALSREQGVTVFMTLLAAFKVLLYRYSGQSDIIVGTPIAGRQQQELEGLIGFFVNTLSLRSEVKGETAFTALLQTVKQTTLEAYEHQDVPFEKVVEAVVKERDLSRSPLFQVMFVLQNMPEMPQIRLGEASITAEAFVYESSKFDIIFNLEETAGGIVLTAEYDTALYKAETIRRMTGHYEELLNNIVKHPDEKINTLKLLGKEEEETITSVFSNIQTTQAQDKNIKSITDLFEEQVLRSPEAIAIEFEEKQLSYQELNARSNQVARYLQEQGVKKEILVPVCIERSPEMLIGILGILKAGGAYVPVDPEYPADRIRYMLEDTGATIALSSKAHQAKLQQASPLIKVLSLNEEHMINGYPQENLPEKIQPDQLAYIIYTSGSTGKPKGVMVEHGGVVNLIKAQTAYFRLSAEERILQFSNYSFDASVEQIFLALFNGAALILFREGLQLDADLFGRFVEEKKISHLHATPLFLEHIRINEAGELKRVIAGGDTCRKALAESWQGRTNFYNEYGPTETTVTAIEYHSGESITGETVPIGRPLNNVTVYILNDNLQPSPVGVTGEVYIGGVQVARGYLNRPELTAERFIADPFGKEAGARLYRAGDLGRWLGDGNIEYQGRVDDQVKIRGYRIELGEIESVLEQQAQVKQGVVLAREDQSGNKILVGYVVSEGVFDREAVIGYLRGRLPEYMVPQVWVELDRLPVTANGKTDRKGLPAAEISDQQRGYEAPGDETEARLAGIWQELLGVEQIGVHDNFFELGGHSLLVIRVISAIRNRLNKNISIRELFVYPTVAGLAGYIKNSDKQLSRSLIPIKPSGRKPPLYIVCGAGGTAFMFREFAKMLDPDQPVYGLQQSTDINDLEGFPGTIEGIAELYIKEILAENPEGPYALSGHCLGGVIAFEMTRQLEAMGKSVSMLALFDTVVSEKEVFATPGINNLYHIPTSIKKSFSNALLKIKFELFLLIKHPKVALSYKIQKTKLRMRDNQPKPENIEQDVFDKMSKILQEASSLYVLEPYNGDILVFYAKEHYYFMDRANGIVYKKINYGNDTRDAWKKYARSVEIVEVEGEHSSIFNPQYADKLAQTLQQHLNELK